MLNAILVPIGIISAFGLLFGIGLAIAAKVFEVPEDPRIPLVRAALPGANCGGCGFPGCDALAGSIVEGSAAVDVCPVGGGDTAAAIAKIMGKEAGSAVKKIATVICQGTCETAPNRADYYGEMDCREAMIASGGAKGCRYGCMGYGTCKSVCPFNAISMGEDGLPKVDPDKCTSCGKCVDACPKSVMNLVPITQEIIVKCHNLDKGKIARLSCTTACIGCGACEKACNFDAIKVENNCAKIDYDKCRQCYECVDKCPMNCISGDIDYGKLTARAGL
ncbi:RnfABCDGE type electron transport complex subunit B [Acetobacterium tundrae]|uniref:Ion-translocating oxidoreductase complex subunit B n=1 Tax=Acetobacterium tundrae TaxID=132932 RepID=A0ABR6WMZ9_9FIRM|nr:RnfABCDGE type electron transport complex subunit B [Acetobacterium tundrae]MBC3797661.1 4Fe-4S dicluster domain-containing protein [Acetobacterium tundrae]